MHLLEERKKIIEFGNKLISHGLTIGTGGNLSIYNREKNMIAISPSGIEFDKTNIEDIVIIDTFGNILEGDKKPSSEIDMHTEIYKNRDDISSVIHAHTTYSSAIACLNIDLHASHYMIAVAGKSIRCAKYASFGTKELAQNAVKAMEGNKAALLANHGIIAGSDTIANTFNIIENIEYCSKVHCIASSIGKPIIIDDDEMLKMINKFTTYGQIDKK